MPEFRYSARNAQGLLVEGTVTASDRSAAIAQVEQKRCVPIRVQPAEAAAPKQTVAVAEPAPPQKSPATAGKETSPSKALTAKPDAAVAKGTSARAGAASSVATAGKGMKLSYSQQYLFSEQLAHLLSAGCG